MVVNGEIIMLILSSDPWWVVGGVEANRSTWNGNGKHTLGYKPELPWYNVGSAPHICGIVYRWRIDQSQLEYDGKDT